MPLAEDRRSITGFAQVIGEGDFLWLNPVRMRRSFRIGEDDAGDARPLLIPSREQSCASRTADIAARMKIGEPHSLRGEPVQVWCSDPAAVRADVTIAEVVRHDDDKVRPGRRRFR